MFDISNNMQQCSIPKGTFQMQSSPNLAVSPLCNQPSNPATSQPVSHIRDPQTDNLSAKLDQVCCKLNKLDNIDARLRRYGDSLGRVTHDVAELKNKHGSIIGNVQSISDMFDKVTIDMKQQLQEMSRDVSRSARSVDDIKVLKSEFHDLRESHIEQQWRSMRDNLIISGIAEDESRESDRNSVNATTEEILNIFIADKLEIDPKALSGCHREVTASTNNSLRK